VVFEKSISLQLVKEIIAIEKREKIVTALFLGAGFSKWAFNLPLVNQLFDFEIDPKNEAEERKLNLLQTDWISWQKDNIVATEEQFIYWCLHKSSHRRSRIIWYVNRRLTEPFMTRIQGSFTSVMFDERVVRENERIIKIKQFINSLSKSGLKGILTCNYDTLVECALGTGGFNYGVQGEQLYGRGLNPQFPWQNAHVSVTGNIPLAKLHGSLSWDSNLKYTSGKPGRSGKALIIPPAPEKTPPPELEDVWTLGEQILSASKQIILFGFAFNTYDQALLNLLKKNGKNITQILLIDPYPNKEAAERLWPYATINTLNPMNDSDLEEYL
jgi:hypothetical protein